MNKEKIVQKLKEKISDKRYEHSVGVAYTAACMAMVYGADVEAARTAGLLHDCAKGLSTKDKLEKARKYAGFSHCKMNCTPCQGHKRF